MTTYGAALVAGRVALEREGVETAALDARLLLAAAAGIDMAALISRDGEKLPDLADEAYRNHLRRRQGGEPVARILGEVEFYGLSFALGADTLVPRPETETLVDVVLDEARRRFPPSVRICDLGTGSGAIAIALLSRLPEAQAVATDTSGNALQIAAENAGRHGVRARMTFHRVDFAEGPEGPFDVVVSNPPYVRSDAIPALQREVREHDPLRALDGGADGLSAYRTILGRIGALLARDGILAFEIGYDQGEPVARLCRKAGLNDVRVETDLGGRDRVVVACAGFRRPGRRQKKRLEKSSDRASFHPQIRAKPQSWHPISRQTRSKIAEGWFARVATA
jgi:release factor glutamine methyltransferase